MSGVTPRGGAVVDRTDRREGPAGSGAGGGKPEASDSCDHRFEVNLISVDLDVVALLVVGEMLQVKLTTDGTFESVLCARHNGAVVGAIAGVPGQSQIMNCLREGRQYNATIVRVSTATVTVRVALAE